MNNLIYLFNYWWFWSFNFSWRSGENQSGSRKNYQRRDWLCHHLHRLLAGENHRDYVGDFNFRLKIFNFKILNFYSISNFLMFKKLNH